MGDGEKMGKPKKRKEYSLKKIVLMVFACSSLLCLLLIIFVTRISMKAMRESKMETSLKATLEEVNQGFESEYNVLLRLSQTMASNGLVGEKYDAYRTAEEQYDKILEYQDFLSDPECRNLGDGRCYAGRLSDSGGEPGNDTGGSVFHVQHKEGDIPAGNTVEAG